MQYALEPVWAGLRYVPPAVLLWLAFLFGRTLRPGAIPLIEQIARRSKAGLSASLCQYTKTLTAVWCAYFLIAAATCMATQWSGSVAYGELSLAVWSGTLVLFVGERALRPRLFPNEVFPGLLQQLRDTLSIWRAPHATHVDTRQAR